MSSPGHLSEVARKLTQHINQSGDAPPWAAIADPLIEILIYEAASHLPPAVRRELHDAGDTSAAMDWVAVGVVMRQLTPSDGLRLLQHVGRNPRRLGEALADIHARARAVLWMGRLVKVSIASVALSFLLRWLAQ